MTNKLLESLRKKLDKTLDNINEKYRMLKKLKQNNKIKISQKN